MSAVSHFTTFEYLDPAGPLIVMKVEMSWTSVDPFAVELRIHRGRGRTTTWIVARDLLAEGLHFAAGIGDVRLRPDGDDPHSLRLRFESPDGQAEFIVPTQALGSFLAETFAEVPAGAEALPDFSLSELIP